MSKIGRKPIALESVKVTIENNFISLQGPNGSFTHQLPPDFVAECEGNELLIKAREMKRDTKRLWGLHRALLANKVTGAFKGFEEKIKIVGLGFKAQSIGDTISFSLGYSHKIPYTVPKGVSVLIDKTGQELTLKGNDKFLLGNVRDAIIAFRPPEPYKGTGIIGQNTVINRKAGKTK